MPVGDKVWFTEWAANNIGVHETSVQPEVSLAVDQEFIILEAGQTQQINMTVVPHGQSAIASFVTLDTAPFDIAVRSEVDSLELDSEMVIPVTIEASSSALSVTHKILVGLQFPDVTISNYITVAILPSESGFIGPT